jgi:hypothetical protein
LARQPVGPSKEPAGGSPRAADPHKGTDGTVDSAAPGRFLEGLGATPLDAVTLWQVPYYGDPSTFVLGDLCGRSTPEGTDS